MQLKTLLLWCATVLLIAGWQQMPDEDGVHCGSDARAKAVYVLIDYNNGVPAPSPAECMVRPGTKVTWMSETNGATEFEIMFKKAIPGEDASGKDLKSRMRGGRQKAWMVANQSVGRHDYGIKANGHDIDPAIIIKN